MDFEDPEIKINALKNIEASAYSVDDFINLFNELKLIFPSDIESRVQEVSVSQLHLAKYWILSKDWFENEMYELALFFSCTLFEEVAKVFLLATRDNNDRKLKHFYNHNKKLNFTALTTIFINSRVNRIYGNKNKHKFEMLCKTGELFELRNSCLYISIQNDKILLPHEEITKEKAALIVCMAGEAYAEIQGLFVGNYGVWENLIKDIDEFRIKNHLFIE
jgi:AbiV family abortive infection protein